MLNWSLAFRNLLRNKRRSISTLTALAIGLAAIVVFRAFESNLGNTILTSVLRAGGHLQVQHKDYLTYGGGNPGAYSITGYQRIVDAIRSDPVLRTKVAMVSPVLKFGGLAGNFDAGISRTVLGTGYNAAEFNAFRKWNEFDLPLQKPDFQLLNTSPDSAVLGVGLARVLQLCKPLRISDCAAPVVQHQAKPKSSARLPSDIAALADEVTPSGADRQRPDSPRIELLASGQRGSPNIASLNVVAAEDQSFKELDDIAVVLHLEQAQKLVASREDKGVTAIMVLLNKTGDHDAVSRRLSKLLAELNTGQSLVVRAFGELNPFYVQSERLFNFIFAFIFVLIGGVVLFTVGNTMNTAVVERTVEIGTLRAIGLRRAGIKTMFLMEGFILGCAGTAIGLMAAMLIAAIVNNAVIQWIPPGSSELVSLRLHLFEEMKLLLLSAVSLVLVATLSAWLPSARAAKLKIVEALRHA